MRPRHSQEGDLSPDRLDAGMPAERFQKGVAPSARGQKKAVRAERPQCGLDGFQAVLPAQPTMNRATGHKADSERGASDHKSLQMPRIAELGQIRQKKGGVRARQLWLQAPHAFGLESL